MQTGVVPSDLDRSIAFYRDVVGLAPAGAIPVLGGRTLHLFDGGGGTFKLVELGPADPTPRPGPRGAFTETTGLQWLTFDIEDLDAITARAEGFGAVWQVRPRELRAGLRFAVLEDPDGVAVELVERRDAASG